MQKPNVLFISSWYPSREHETLGNFVQRHAEAINPFVNLYVVCAISSEAVVQDLEIENNQINGVHTTIVYYKKVTHSIPLISNLTKLKRYKEAYKNGIQFVENQFDIKIWDVTHCNVTFPAGLIALDLKRKKNTPYIVTEHWTLFLPYNNGFKKLNPFKKKAIKEIVSNADKMAPVSHHLHHSMNALGLKGSYTVIPNVVDTELFQPKLPKKNKAVKQILHVSTLNDDQKNITGIFQVLKKISRERNDFKLVIVSDGDIEKAKQIQNEVGLEDSFVEYHGTKTPEELVEFYQEVDFFLLYSNYENLPVVISESLCCGLPVVTSSVGGIPEMINEHNGIIVNPDRNKKLRKAISTMLDNLEQYDPKSIRNVAIKKYNKEVVGKRYYEVYKSIIK